MVVIVVMVIFAMVVVMPLANVAGADQADVVAEVTVEHPDTALVGAVVETQGQVGGNGFFLVQAGIANLEGSSGHVGTIGIQLVEGRGALGVAEVGGQRPDRVELVHRPGRQAEGIEAAGAVSVGEVFVAFGIRVDPGVFHACAQAQVQALGGLPLLQHE